MIIITEDIDQEPSGSNLISPYFCFILSCFLLLNFCRGWPGQSSQMNIDTTFSFEHKHIYTHIYTYTLIHLLTD